MAGFPGTALSSPLDNLESLAVRQQKEWGEILTGWETRNRYQVCAPDGMTLLLAGEVGSGIGAVLLRQFLKNKRPFRMEVRTPTGEVVLDLNRPWRWLFSSLEISANGQRLGTIERRFAWFERKYDVLGASGEELATIEGPLFRPWTFLINQRGMEVGRILKKWSGLGKELFTKADNFRLEFSPQLADTNLRWLVLGATFLIDFVHFESKE